jgi:hypothetical protein
VPGYPDAVLDIVPVDFVATSVARLVFDEAALGSTVHLCAGPRGSATIQQVARRAAEYFHVPEPRYVDPKFFFAALRPLLFLSLWGRKRRVLRDGRAYRDYFTMRMQFDTSNAERLLKAAGVCPPPVLDDENGRPVRAGVTGECQIRRRGLAPHYWKDKGDGQGLLTRDGWLRTGDLATRNRLGLIRLVGRMKDVIKSGGYSVYVRELGYHRRE